MVGTKSRRMSPSGPRGWMRYSSRNNTPLRTLLPSNSNIGAALATGGRPARRTVTPAAEDGVGPRYSLHSLSLCLASRALRLGPASAVQK